MRRPAPSVLALVLTSLALLGLASTARAQSPLAPLASPCPTATELKAQDLHGLWRLVLWPEGGSESAPASTGAMLFGPHPEYPGSVRGRLRRSGPGADLEAEVAGDVGDDGEFNLDESADGRAMDVWRRMISAQGGDPDAELPTARETETVLADSDGVLTTLDAYAVGLAAWRLGAGRARKEDPVQAAAGIEMHAKPGDEVRAGQPLMTLHTDTPERFARAREALAGGWQIGEDGPAGSRSVVLDRITAEEADR